MKREICGVCAVCGKEAVVIADSMRVAMEYPYCQECIDERREPYEELVYYMAFFSIDEEEYLKDHRKDTIDNTLKVLNKTLDELFKDVKEMEKVITSIDMPENQPRTKIEINFDCSES